LCHDNDFADNIDIPWDSSYNNSCILFVRTLSLRVHWYCQRELSNISKFSSFCSLSHIISPWPEPLLACRNSLCKIDIALGVAINIIVSCGIDKSYKKVKHPFIAKASCPHRCWTSSIISKPALYFLLPDT